MPYLSPMFHGYLIVFLDKEQQFMFIIAINWVSCKIFHKFLRKNMGKQRQTPQSNAVTYLQNCLTQPDTVQLFQWSSELFQKPYNKISVAAHAIRYGHLEAFRAALSFEKVYTPEMVCEHLLSSPELDKKFVIKTYENVVDSRLQMINDLQKEKAHTELWEALKLHMKEQPELLTQAAALDWRLAEAVYQIIKPEGFAHMDMINCMRRSLSSWYDDLTNKKAGFTHHHEVPYAWFTLLEESVLLTHNEKEPQAALLLNSLKKSEHKDTFIRLLNDTVKHNGYGQALKHWLDVVYLPDQVFETTINDSTDVPQNLRELFKSIISQDSSVEMLEKLAFSIPRESRYLIYHMAECAPKYSESLLWRLAETDCYVNKDNNLNNLCYGSGFNRRFFSFVNQDPKRFFFMIFESVPHPDLTDRDWWLDSCPVIIKSLLMPQNILRVLLHICIDLIPTLYRMASLIVPVAKLLWSLSMGMYKKPCQHPGGFSPVKSGSLKESSIFAKLYRLITPREPSCGNAPESCGNSRN